MVVPEFASANATAPRRLQSSSAAVHADSAASSVVVSTVTSEMAATPTSCRRATANPPAATAAASITRPTTRRVRAVEEWRTSPSLCVLMRGGVVASCRYRILSKGKETYEIPVTVRAFTVVVKAQSHAP